MAAHGGSRVINNGLVFAFDKGSDKTFAGAPTENLLATAGLDCAVERSGNSYPFTSRNITSQIQSTWSSSNPTYAMSFEGKRDYVAGGSGGGNDGYPVMYIYFTDWSWSTTINVKAYDWAYTSKTFTMPNPAGKTIYFATYHMNSGNRGKSYGRNFQIEKSNFVTPFVNGTRGTTNAFRDWKGKRTVTANALSYTGGKQYGFSGSSSISVPSLHFPDGQTIEIWLRPTENDSVRRNPYNQAYGGYGTWTHEPNGTINYYYGDGAGNASPYIGHNSGFTVGQNELACVCTTRGTSNSVWYKNGERYSQYNHSFGSLTAHNTGITIGQGYAGFYVGDILSVKLYDRQLSDAEVKRNFEAYRKRYGL